MLNKKKTYLYLLLFLVFFIVFLEFFSKIILYTNTTFFKGKEISLKIKSDNKKTDDAYNRGYSIEVAREIDKAISKAHYYESYLIWKYKAVKSKHLNMDDSGYRIHSKNAAEKKANEKKIWFLGGSEVFGIINNDDNTAPAHLEKLLNKNYNENFSVKNMGQLSYISLQTFLSLKYELLKPDIEKPDLVIILNGFDDFKNFWKTGNVYGTDLYTDEFFSKYWDMYNKTIFFDKEKFFYLLESKYFNNTFLLFKKIKKYMLLHKYENNPDTWKKDYLNYTKNYTKIIRENIDKYHSFYISNMRNISTLCKKNNIKLLLIHTPTLFTTNKKLASSENNDFFHVGNYYFSMSKSKITNIEEVPSHHILRKWYWDLNYFREGYAKQKALLEDLSLKMQVNYFDLSPILNDIDDEPVFNNFSYTTDLGNKVYANAIEKIVMNILKK